MKALLGFLLLVSLEASSYSFILPDGPDRGGGRIVGGVVIQLSQAPYQVSLLYRGGHMCGG